MARDFAIKFYNSKAWKKCRDSYALMQNYICERCGAVGKEVHHKIYLSPENIGDPFISLSHDNLELLCESCHSLEHNLAGEPVREGLGFGPSGDLIRDPTLKKWGG